MNSKISFVVSFLIGALALSVANQAQAQTTANGPYYATPSWDQKLQCDTQATCPRFIVLSNWNNEAVLDRETGLVWERSPVATIQDWEEAHLHCNQKTVGSRKGWRLPTIQELASLIDPTVPFPGPTLPAGHPFSNAQSALYWSATSSVHSGRAWDVFFNGLSGFDVNHTPKSSNLSVWCVRGGQGVELQ